VVHGCFDGSETLDLYKAVCDLDVHGRFLGAHFVGVLVFFAC